MKAPKQLQQLIAEIIDEFPQAELGFDPLPSGVCWLNIWLGRRNFEMEYNPTRGTAISENFEDTPPFIGHDHAFKSLEEGVSRFKLLLIDAARTEADHLPKTLVLNEDPLPWNNKS